MKHHSSFFFSNLSASFLFVVLFATSAFAETLSPASAQEATTEVVTSSANINGVEMSTTTVMQEGVPGRVTVNSAEVTAKVTAIDAEIRKVTLLLSDGEEKKVMVSPEAVNFDQIQVGDLVKATLTEEVVIYLDEEGALVPDGFAAGVALAPKGAKPGVIVAGAVKVTATVTAIDEDKRTATLRFDDGTDETFPVRDDIDLSKRKEGEKVVFLITETVALSVEKP